MPESKRRRIPKMQHHRASGQARVTLDGQDFYLGKFGSAKALEAYNEKIQEWTENGYKLPVPQDELTVVELAQQYVEHTNAYYRRPDGSETSTAHNTRVAIRALRERYGDLPCAEFGPIKLRALREHWIAEGLSRATIGHYVRAVKSAFRWGASHELLTVEIHQRLATVESLKKGRSKAKETKKVTPVSQADIEAIRPHVSRQVWAMVQLQLLTGARSGEIVGLRPSDLDTSGKVWTVTIDEHKTSHLEKSRVLYFGPRAQAILREFMVRPPDMPLFSPKEAERERHAKCEEHRRPGQKPNERKTSRTLGEQYDVSSYRRAVKRACELAGATKWTPHRLRHTAATRFRHEYDIDTAQVLLGHSSASVTQIYAEVDRKKAISVIEKIG